MQENPRDNITYKIIDYQDPLARNFFELRKEVLAEDLERDNYRSEANIIDEQSKFVVALNHNNDVIGGCRIQFGGKRETNVVLAFRMTEIYDSFKYIIPDIPLENLHRAEVSQIVVKNAYTNLGIAKDITTKALELSKEKDTDILFVLPYEKQRKVPQIFSSAAESLNIKTYNFIDEIGHIHLINKSDKEGSHSENAKHLLICSPNGTLNSKLNATENKDIHWEHNYENPRIALASNYMQHEISCLVFDWDRVMVDPIPAYTECYSYAISRMIKEGHKPITINFNDPVFIKTQEYFKNIFGDDKLAEKATEYTFQHYQNNNLHITKSPAIKDARKTLELAHEAQIPVIIVSNNWQWVVEDQYKNLFGDLPLKVQIYGDARKGKEPIIGINEENNLKEYSKNKTIERALQAANIEINKSVYMVGDTPLSDGVAAMASGISYILFGLREVSDIKKLDQEKGLNENIGFVRDHQGLQTFIRENRRANKQKNFIEKLLGEKEFKKIFGSLMPEKFR